MENLEVIVRVGKEIGLTEEELQSWVTEEQDFCIGEQKWCKDMIELKEKRLMIQAEEINKLKDTVAKLKEERDNIEKRIENLNNEIAQMKEEVMNVKKEKYTAEQTKNIIIEKLNSEIEQMKEEVMNVKEEKYTAEQKKNITIENLSNEIEQMKKEKTDSGETQNTMMQKLKDDLAENKKAKIDKEQKVTMRSIQKCHNGEGGSSLKGIKLLGTSDIEDRCESGKYQNELTARRYKKANSNSRKMCYRCGSSEHLIKDCTKAYSKHECLVKYRQTQPCRVCRKLGHTEEDCWLKEQQKDGQRRCFRCGSTEHMVKDCARPRRIGSVIAHKSSKQYKSIEERKMEMMLVTNTVLDTILKKLGHCKESFLESQSGEEVNLLHIRDTGGSVPDKK